MGCSHNLIMYFQNQRALEKFIHEKLDDLEEGFD